MVRYRVFVSGRVQGVGYRFFVLGAAQPLGLSGWVRNLADGRVEVLAQGEMQALQELLAKLDEGPATGHVDAVDATWEDSPAEAGFRVLS